MTAKELLTIAKNEIGTKESPANSNNVKYNTWIYGKEVTGSAYPWCAAFVSWCFRNAQGLCPKTASCLNMLSWFEKNNQVVKNPKPGDIVFFKYSTNSRRTNHVGIVESVDGYTINTIEGNTSSISADNGGKVLRRKRKTNIVAFARPKYTDEVKPNIEAVAREVIDGKWGSGNDRRQRLERAGYNYREVQDKVNEILKR